MKKLLFACFIIIGLVTFQVTKASFWDWLLGKSEVEKEQTSEAQFGDTIGTLPQWKDDAGYLTPRDNTDGVKVPTLSSSGNCVVTDGSGIFSTASCGTGGGGAGGGWSTSTPNFITTNWASATNALVGINSSTPWAVLTVKGISGTTTPTFVVASSTNAMLLRVASNGSTTLSSLGTGPVYGSSGSLYTNGTTGTGLTVQATSPTLVTPILGVASGTALTLSGNLWVTGQTSLGNASSTALTVSGLSKLATTSLVGTLSVSGSTTISSLGTGLVRSVSGALFNGSASLTTDVSGTLPVANGGTGATTLTSGSLLMGNGTSAISASSLSQSGGTTLINGSTPIINAGGIWISDIVQSSGANFIVQSPTSTAALGNVVFGGGVQYIQTHTYLSNTQFCTGGLFNVASGSPVNVYLPPLTQIGYGLAPSNCTTGIYGGNWTANFIANTGTSTVTTNASGTGETLMFAPGTGATLQAGQSWLNLGQFTATSTLLGATTTGMSLNAYFSAFQRRATNPTMQGQFLMASSTTSGGNPEWVVGNIIAGANITVSTSTAGQITITGSAGGSGNSAWTIGSGFIYNATSTDSILVGTSTPTTSNLFVQGSGVKSSITIASSSGTTLFQVTASAQILACATCRMTGPVSATPTISAAGDFGTDTSNGGMFSFYANGRENLNATTTKAFFIQSPTASESHKTVPGYSFDVPVTITKVRCLITSDSNTPSWTFSLPHSTALGTASANAMSSGQACTSTTTPQTITINGDLTLAAGETIWATSSAVTSASSTTIFIDFKYDN